MKTLAVNNFSGGVNNYVSPKSLPDGQMQELRNGIGDGVSLKPVKAPSELGVYDLVDLNHYGWKNRSVAKWYGRWYWSINDAIASPYYGGNDEIPGIPYPDTTPSVASEATGITGTFQYCITFLNASLWESAPGNAVDQWWTTISLTNQKAKITLPASVPAGIAHMRLYRSTDEGNSFYLVGQYLASEVDTVIADSMADIDLVLCNPLETINLLPPPDAGKYLTERDGVFYLAVNDRLFISQQSNPHGWNPANWIGFDGNDITGIAKEFTGVLVFTANKTFRVTGSDISTLTKQEIPGQQGCVNYRTIGTAGSVPAWVSNDGICVWDGNQIQIVTKQRYVWNGDAVHAGCANDRYYLFLSVGMVIFDYRAGGIFRTMNIGVIPEYGWYDPDLDRFYMADAQTGGTVYMFEAGNNMQFTYISGVIPQDGMVQKRFRRLLIDAAGEVTAKVTSDGGKVLNSILSGSGRLAAFFPSGFYGRGVTVQLESSHEIYSYVIEYEEIGI